MGRFTLGDGIQVATAVLVLLGLILVVWELQQTRELARAQLVSDAFSAAIAKDIALLGENFSRTRAKACLEPDKLNSQELFEMRAYYRILTNEIMATKDNEAVFRGSTVVNWRGVAELHLRELLSTKYGRIAWERTREGQPAYIQQVANELLRSGRVLRCEAVFSKELQYVQRGKDPRN